MMAAQGEPFALGLYVGLRIPLDSDPTGPPFAEPAMSEYLSGVQAARDYRQANEGDYQGPAVDVVPPDGVTLEEYEERGREILESLFHEHMPHIEIPEFEPVLPPPYNVPR